MLNVSGKFITVFQPNINLQYSEKVVIANLSSSKKNTDSSGNVTYENMK
jgi:hypothetical protein